jgi:hypothetical protein
VPSPSAPAPPTPESACLLPYRGARCFDAAIANRASGRTVPSEAGASRLGTTSRQTRSYPETGIGEVSDRAVPSGLSATRKLPPRRRGSTSTPALLKLALMGRCTGDCPREPRRLEPGPPVVRDKGQQPGADSVRQRSTWNMRERTRWRAQRSGRPNREKLPAKCFRPLPPE